MTQLLDSYDGTVNVDTFIEAQHPSPSNDISAWGQTFRLISDYLLTSVKLIVRRTSSSSTGTFKVYLYAHLGTYGSSGIPTGLPLATSTTSINWDDLPFNAWTFIEFEFDGTYTLQANTAYCIVVYSLDGVFDGSRWCRIGSSSLKGHGGNACGYVNGAWGYSTSRDVFFYVYGEEVSSIIEIKGMKGEGTYGWDSTNEVHAKTKVDATGILQTS